MKLILISLIFFVSGCTTSAVLEDSNQSINEIRQQIKNLVGSFRSVSRNQRELVSGYFARRSDDADFDPDQSSERLWAKFVILGDRRPYDIEIRVIKEKRVNGKFQQVGLDKGMSLKLVEELKAKLNESLENRNIIDDFRAF